jgi:hypothetical protein
MSWKINIPDGQRKKLVELLKNFASKKPDEVRKAVMRLAEADYMEMLIQCIKRRLRDDSGEEATALFNSMFKSFLANDPIDEKPGSPRRLETFDPTNPLKIIVQNIDKRVKRIFREKKLAQLSVIEGRQSGSLDGTTELTKVLSTGEYANSDEELPQALLIMAELKEGVEKAFMELDPELRELATKRWLITPPVPWKDIEKDLEIAERQGQRMLEKARGLLENKLREMGLLNDDEADS